MTKNDLNFDELLSGVLCERNFDDTGVPGQGRTFNVNPNQKFILALIGEFPEQELDRAFKKTPSIVSFGILGHDTDRFTGKFISIWTMSHGS